MVMTAEESMEIIRKMGLGSKLANSKRRTRTDKEIFENERRKQIAIAKKKARKLKRSQR
jgi:hypothetical protein